MIGGSKTDYQEETGLVALSWNIYDNFTFTGSYRDGDEKKPFHHLGLIYHVTEFKDSALRMDICKEDVAGAAWIALDSDKELTPFTRRVSLEFRNKIFVGILGIEPSSSTPKV